MSGYIIDCRAKQSFPLFWVFGSLGGLGFAFAGGFIIHGYMSLNPYEREGGMIAAGIAFLIMGVLLLAGVVFTLIKTADPNDLSFKVEIDQARVMRKAPFLRGLKDRLLKAAQLRALRAGIVVVGDVFQHGASLLYVFYVYSFIFLVFLQ